MEMARALRPSALVMRQPKSGKGDALIAGFHAASGDIIVTLDADGSQKVDEIPLFVGPCATAPTSPRAPDLSTAAEARTSLGCAPPATGA